MYQRQRGFRVILYNFLSIALFLIAAFISAGAIYIAFGSKQPIHATITEALYPWLLLTFPILIFSSKYPDFKFTKEGLHYRYMIFFGGLIKWEEISGLLKINHPKSMTGVYALLIDREGYRFPFWFKGLYFSTMHAIRLRTYAPVILITPESITEEEKNKIKAIIQSSDNL